MTERYVKISNENDIPIKGISLQILDDKIEAVIISDGESTIRIVKSSEYSSELKILKKESLIEVEKWYVFGLVNGIAEYEKEFESRDDAHHHLNDLYDKNGIRFEDEKEKFGLNIESRKVMVENKKIG